MPLYEYQCDACGRRFELIRKFSDPPLDKCPHCGRVGPVHKLMSSPAIQFKGSGWYITDYAKKDSTTTGGSGESKRDTGTSDKEKSAGDKTEKGDKSDKVDKPDKPAKAEKSATTESSKSEAPAAASSKKET
jgi:putative FmdB family regulatory protein